MSNFKEFVLKSRPRLKEVWFMSLYSYNTLSNEAEQYANQRVIEELEARLSIKGNDCANHICSKIQDRIKELKQD